MSADWNGHTTDLLRRSCNGELEPREQLLALLYGELRTIAARRLRRERANHTLQPTALVNEAYLRMAEQSRVRWESRSHFLALAATAMRRVLVDHARKRHAAKRGAGLAVSFDDELAIPERRDPPLLALDEALHELERLDPRQARLVELRYFGGLNIEQTAEALGISPATVKREWATARLWLRSEILRRQP